MDPRKAPKYLISAGRRILTVTFALLILGVLTWAYVAGIQLVADQYRIMAFGLYGVFLAAHLVIQSFFASLEHRRMRRESLACSYTKTVALTISAYQEDPSYLRQCLESVRATLYPPEKLQILMVIDGNSPDDRYMMDMFQEVFAGEDVGTYVWENNYHQLPPREGEEGGRRLPGGRRGGAWALHRGGDGGPGPAGGGGVDPLQAMRLHHAAMGREAGGDVHGLQGAGQLGGLYPGVRLRHQAGPQRHGGDGEGVGGQQALRSRGGRCADPERLRLLHQLHEQPALLDGLQRGARLPVLLRLRLLHQRAPGPVPERPPAAVPGVLVQPEIPGHPLHLRRRPAPHQPHAEHGLRHQVHGPLPLLLRDPRPVPALAGPADPLDQVLLPRVALQCPLVAPASPVDDLRGRGGRRLPLLRDGHRPAPLLRRQPVGRAVGPALRPAGGLHQGALRLLAAGQPPHALHEPLRPALHGRPPAGQVLRHRHHEQEQLGHLREEEDGGQLDAPAARLHLGVPAAGRAELHHLPRGPGQMDQPGQAGRAEIPGHRGGRLPGLLGRHGAAVLGVDPAVLPEAGRPLHSPGV
ncbi:unnamed protein product, partial [Eretmochelys imbricata]